MASEDYKEDELLKRRQEIKEDALPQKKVWWERLPPVVLVIISVVFIIILYLMSTAQSKNGFYVLIGGVIVVIILLSLQKQTSSLPPLRADEAEAIAYLEMDRKLRWNQLPSNTTYRICDVVADYSMDSAGVFWSIPIIITYPFTHKEIQREGRVFMSGERRGHFSLRGSPHQIDGNEHKPEKRILSKDMNDLKREGLLERMMFSRGNT